MNRCNTRDLRHKFLYSRYEHKKPPEKKALNATGFPACASLAKTLDPNTQAVWWGNWASALPKYKTAKRLAFARPYPAPLRFAEWSQQFGCSLTLSDRTWRWLSLKQRKEEQHTYFFLPILILTNSLPIGWTVGVISTIGQATSSQKWREQQKLKLIMIDTFNSTRNI